MTTTLRAVLTAFENAQSPLSLNELAAQLQITPGLLDGMLTHWVRKGKLREVSSAHQCGSCGGAEGCPFMMHMPRTYELATGDEQPPVCGTCSPVVFRCHIR